MYSNNAQKLDAQIACLSTIRTIGKKIYMIFYRAYMILYEG